MSRAAPIKGPILLSIPGKVIYANAFPRKPGAKIFCSWLDLFKWIKIYLLFVALFTYSYCESKLPRGLKERQLLMRHPRVPFNFALGERTTVCVRNNNKMNRILQQSRASGPGGSCFFLSKTWHPAIDFRSSCHHRHFSEWTPSTMWDTWPFALHCLRLNGEKTRF